MTKIVSFSECLVAGALIIMLLGLPSTAQQSPSTPSPEFEVVSVKKVVPPPPPGPGAIVHSLDKGCRYLTDRVSCQSSILELAREAYQLDYIRLAAPKWTNDDSHVFTVQGTMASGTTRETARLMLRQMLAERFGLKVHWEKRDIPVYALVPGKHGVKLRSADDPANRKTIEVETPMGRAKTDNLSGGGVFFNARTSMDLFAANVRYRANLDRPVVNMTGLTGQYYIDLQWTPDEQSGGVGESGFLAAMREQLGLRLEKRTLPYDVLVVDHCEEAPTAN